jgi:hypothetical protein
VRERNFCLLVALIGTAGLLGSGCEAGHQRDSRSAAAPAVEVVEVSGGRTIDAVRLRDGTRCAVYRESIHCDWSKP